MARQRFGVRWTRCEGTHRFRFGPWWPGKAVSAPFPTSHRTPNRSGTVNQGDWGTSNNQHPTSNDRPSSIRWALDVGCWLLDVPPIHGEGATGRVFVGGGEMVICWEVFSFQRNTEGKRELRNGLPGDAANGTSRK